MHRSRIPERSDKDNRECLNYVDILNRIADKTILSPLWNKEEQRVAQSDRSPKIRRSLINLSKQRLPKCIFIGASSTTQRRYSRFREQPRKGNPWRESGNLAADASHHRHGSFCCWFLAPTSEAASLQPLDIKLNFTSPKNKSQVREGPALWNDVESRRRGTGERAQEARFLRETAREETSCASFLSARARNFSLHDRFSRNAVTGNFASRIPEICWTRPGCESNCFAPPLRTGITLLSATFSLLPFSSVSFLLRPSSSSLLVVSFVRTRWNRSENGVGSTSFRNRDINIRNSSRDE